MLERLKEQVVAVAKEADRLGMCRHKSGNFSIYDPETGYVAITPSGVSRDVLATGHICVMDLSGRVIQRQVDLKPSSEAMMHLYIYKERKDIRAIVHTHARYSTAFAIMNKPIPPILYESAYLGKTGMVPVAPYARAGTVELALKVAEVMKDNEVCLMESHGAIAAGSSLEDAFLKAQYVEEIAEMYYITLASANGAEPKALPPEELEKWAYPKEILL